MSTEKETENLFSYGTLKSEAVQLATFGRKLEGKPDMLAGYCIKTIRIEDQNFVVASGGAYHRIIQFTGTPSDCVEGTVLRITSKELEHADSYEPAEYKRIFAELKSGVHAWVYVGRHEQ